MPFRLPTLRTYLILSFILALNEVLSYVGYVRGELGVLFFVCIIVAAALATWKKLEYGLLIVFTELFIGGKGYLYSIAIHASPQRVSIRIALFVTLFIIWLIKYRRSWTIAALPTMFRRLLYIFGFFVLVGVLNGLMARHGINEVYYDANAYLFFLLLIVIMTPSLDKRFLMQVLIALLGASATILGIKSLFSLGIFAHLSIGRLATYYRWIRNTGVGEIAYINGNSYRVFFQSQVYGVLSFLALAPFVVPKHDGEKRALWLLIPMTFALTAVLISLSRSFWLGGSIAAAAGAVLLARRHQWKVTQYTRIFIVAALMVATAYMLTSWMLNFPYPFPPSRGSSAAKLLEQRFSSFGNEAAASSRLQLLTPLVSAIQKNPFIGSGFAQTVTYKSNDPRQVQSATKGIYNTDAFEWGYLDMILKIGIIGVAAFVGALLYIMVRLFRASSDLTSGFLLGIIALMAIHVTTPYLNHPLGIGFVLIATMLMIKQKNTDELL